MEDAVTEVVRDAALVVDQSAVLLTPVDTGRARANWIPSVSFPKRESRRPDRSGQRAISEARGEVQQYNILTPNGIFLTNSVPYIIPLENGHSRQAPFGMARQAVQAGAFFVRQRSGNVLRNR